MPEKNSETKSFHDRFSIKDELGKGAFATVLRCVNKITKKEYAVKVFKKEKLSDRDLYKIEKEMLICAKLHHPHIVRLHEVASDSKYHYLIFDLVTGGELFDDLVSSREGSYSEVVTARCMFQLLETVAYCHSVGVVHRDLKPENILLESKENKIIKVADFGLAVEVGKDEVKWFGTAGTLLYMAPEILEMKAYGRPVDCWSCGVIMYVLMTGFLPFHHRDERQLMTLIKMGDYDMQHKTWDTISFEGKDLVQKLLCVVPNRRLMADQALKHPWFMKMKTIKEECLVRTDTFERLKQFNARRKLKSAGQASSFITSFLTWRRKERPQRQVSTASHSITNSSSLLQNKATPENK